MAGTTNPEPKEDGFEEPTEHNLDDSSLQGDDTVEDETVEDDTVEDETVQDGVAEPVSGEVNAGELEEEFNDPELSVEQGTTQSLEDDFESDESAKAVEQDASNEAVEPEAVDAEVNDTRSESDASVVEIDQEPSDDNVVPEDVAGEELEEESVIVEQEPVDVDPVDEAFVAVKTPRNQTVSPSPIPVLDRPPTSSNANVSVSSINALYEEDPDSPNEAFEEDLDATHVIERVESPQSVRPNETDADQDTIVISSTESSDAPSTDGAASGTARVAGTPLATGTALAASPANGETEDSDVEEGRTQVFAVPATSMIAGTEQTKQNNTDGDGAGTPPNEPFADFEEEKSGRGWVKGLVGTVAALLIVGGSYAGAQYFFADKIAKDVEVAGVSIAGLTEVEAAAKLDAELSGRLEEEMTLAADDLQTEIVPSELGFALDSVQTVSGLTGFTWDPVDLWEHITGAPDVEPVLSVDPEKFSAGIAPVESALYVEPVNGTVSFIDGAAVATEAVDGIGVSLDDAQALISAHVFNQVRPVVVEPQPISPDVTQEATDEGLAAAKKIASAAVTVEVDKQKAEIPQEAFTQDIEVTYEDGKIGFVFDGKKLSKEVLARTNDLVRETQDAYFTFSGGKPKIVAEVKGTALDADTLATDFAVAAQTDERTFAAELVETEPEDTTKSLKKLGVKEIVASFSTPITNDFLRTENLRVAAKRVTGTLVKPGEQFDLYQVIGPIDASNGYHNAGVIVNGKHTDGMGGGLSQMSTTTYNAGFFAGMTDIAHRPHTVWIPRYPEGRESTLYVGSIDMIWQNDSDKGVLMRSYVANGKLTVEAWGTKTYKVATSTSPRRNVSPATMTTSTAADCEPYPVGQPGFSVTVFRKVTEIATGAVVKDESNSWTYRPDNGVTCEKPETKQDKKDEKDD